MPNVDVADPTDAPDPTDRRRLSRPLGVNPSDAWPAPFSSAKVDAPTDRKPERWSHGWLS
jgi:hypothetical protein